MFDIHTAYTCPLLMLLTWVWLNLTGRRARWERSDYGCYRLIIPIAQHGYEATCVFPERLIRLECAAWNTLPGLLIRKGIGL